MKTFHFNDEFVERYKKFLSSGEFRNTRDYSKSAYWEHFADKVGVEINGNKITVRGVSGFYIPQKRGTVNKILSRLKVAINNPKHVVKLLAAKVWPKSNNKNLVSFEKSFDAVMLSGSAYTENTYPALDFNKIAKNKRSL